MKVLNLSGNNFSSPKFEHVALFLYDNKYLEHIHLSECQITTKGAQAVMEGLIKNSSLKGLYLAKNRIAAEGLIKL